MATRFYAAGLAERRWAMGVARLVSGMPVGLGGLPPARLASYVDNVSAGDSMVIESAGFAVRSTPVPIGELPAPTDLQAKSGEHPGHADLKWKGQYGAKAYNIERATDSAELTWQFMGSTTKGEASLNSMLSGKKYWFRVAAVGTAGTSAWSDPVPLVAQ